MNNKILLFILFSYFNIYSQVIISVEDEKGSLGTLKRSPIISSFTYESIKYGFVGWPNLFYNQNDNELFCLFSAGYWHVSPAKKNYIHPSIKTSWTKNGFDINLAQKRGGAIFSIKSKDKGQTWEGLKKIIDTDNDDRHPTICRIDENTLICYFFVIKNNYGYPFLPSYINNNSDLYYSISYNNASTWSEPYKIKTPSSYYHRMHSPPIKISDKSCIIASYVSEYNSKFTLGEKFNLNESINSNNDIIYDLRFSDLEENNDYLLEFSGSNLENYQFETTYTNLDIIEDFDPNNNKIGKNNYCIYFKYLGKSNLQIYFNNNNSIAGPTIKPKLDEFKVIKLNNEYYNYSNYTSNIITAIYELDIKTGNIDIKSRLSLPNEDLDEPTICYSPKLNNYIVFTRPNGHIFYLNEKFELIKTSKLGDIHPIAPQILKSRDNSLIMSYGSRGKYGGVPNDFYGICILYSNDGGLNWVSPKKERGFKIDGNNSVYLYSTIVEIDSNSYYLAYYDRGFLQKENTKLWGLKINKNSKENKILSFAPGFGNKLEANFFNNFLRLNYDINNNKNLFYSDDLHNWEKLIYDKSKGYVEFPYKGESKFFLEK